MTELATNTPSNQDELWKQYELCRDSAQGLETLIWQTSAGLGVGSLGTLILVANHPENEQLPWYVVVTLGALVLFMTILWWYMARRWWSIQHAFLIRMRHIEEDLGIYYLAIFII